MLKSKHFCWLFDTCFGYHSLALDRIEALIEAKWSGDLVQIKSSIIKKGVLNDPNIRLFDIPISLKYLSDFEKVIRFTFIGLKVKPSIFIASQPLTCLSAWIAGTILSKPVIYFTFELVGEEFEQISRYQKFINRIHQRIERFLLKRVDAEIHLCQEISKVYIEERGAIQETTYTIEPLVRFKNNKILSPNKIMNVLNLNIDNKKVIMYTGAIMEHRCIPDIIEAIPHMKHKNIVFILVGKEFEENYYEKSILPIVKKLSLHRQVFLLNWVDPSLLSEYISLADVGIALYPPEPRNNYFATSSRMSFYIQKNVPVVTPEYPYLQKLVTHNGIGVCTKSLEHIDIAVALDKVLNKPKEYWTKQIEKVKPYLNGEKERKKFVSIIEQTNNQTVFKY